MENNKCDRNETTNNKCCEGDTAKSNKVQSKVLKIKPVSKQNNIITENIVASEKTCCCTTQSSCSSEPTNKVSNDEKWTVGEISREAYNVPQISTQLTFEDILGTWKARWGINRMSYKINPGLYAVGNPDENSQVLVSANYKLTFDALRKELSGLNLWLVILDTKGINVWCAAGKGTFGTEEIVRRIEKINLNKIVSHRTLILPQLGAPGVSAHEVTKKTGFKVIYGPVRASDIKEFITSGMKATEKMRTVKFGFYDRLVLTPIELVGTLKLSMMIFGIMFLLNLFVPKPFGVFDLYSYVGALIAGCVITPALLPWIPGRAFAWKGWIVGMLWAVSIIFLNGMFKTDLLGILRTIGYILVLPSISAFYAMNFTGASTYTSLSGVLKEMKIAVPGIFISIGLGLILILSTTLLGGGGL